MDNFRILTQSSSWLVVVCLLAGLGYAYLLYQKKSPWNKNINYFLASLRFLLVSLLAFLLLGPFIKYFKNYIEKPMVVLAIDNSQSIALAENKDKLAILKSDLRVFQEKLENASIDVSIQTLGNILSSDKLNDLSFDYTSTNLSNLLNDIQSNYENRNLAGVVLVSDGIYNQGMAPDYSTFNFPIHTIGIGDTIPKTDLNLKTVVYNKLSFRNNKFPLVAEIYNKGFVGKSTQVELKQGSKIIASKAVFFRSDNEVNKVEFYASSAETGMQHYTIEVKPLKEEFTLRNNLAHAYVDIIENKEKILLIASSPHPDIKAIRAAIEKKENYEFHLVIPGIHEYKEDKYDLIILHQLPDYSSTAKNIVDKIIKEDHSLLFVIGNQTNLNQFNTSNKLLTILSRQGQKDLVLPSFNSNFDRFITESEDKTIINDYPPLIAAYGEYSLKESADVLMFQKIGNIASSRPLIMISEDHKQAVIAGEGLWQWRQHEYLETQDSKAFDTFVGNLVQYLSAKEDKRKFRVFPISNEFMIDDPVLFEAELYNDLFEKVYGQKIDLKIIDEVGKYTDYSFANGENNSRFEVKGLKQGVYKYYATTDFGGKVEKSDGRFTIKELMFEAVNTTADFVMLRQLSAKNGGLFFNSDKMNKLSDLIIAGKPKNTMHTNEELLELISIPWLFFLFLTLACTEWFFRKYKGSY
ncbi:MAG TPA: hypothetical protein VK766_08930 [Cytophagaceae bacterium]|jgi:hypothetical protein|nr:hypothetical protein [Cytophagaceae bacterium]